MSEPRFSTSTVIMVVAIVGAAAFAAGRTTSSSSSTVAHTTSASAEAPAPVGEQPLPVGHPAVASSGDQQLPVGHPPVAPSGPNAPAFDPAMMGAGAGAGKAETELSWKTPSRWESVPNASSMRLATYRVPRAAGDTADAEVSVMQAGGAVDANVERWIGQFGEEGKRTAKRTTKKVGSLDVVLVEVEGTFDGGMGKDARSERAWALYGAIVSTPGMPHFFKMTGPTRSVKAAHAELDELVTSLSLR
jgi:hypothetical protein